MKRSLIALALAIACILALAACSGQGGAQSGQSSSNSANAGLAVAYEKLKASDDVGSSDAFEYDEESDVLVVDLSEVDDLDSFFEIMDGAVDGADIGTLSLKGWGKNIDAKSVSKWLGDLPCNSLKCFDMGGSGAPSLTSVLDEELDWTDLLAKTEVIYNPSTDAIRSFSPSAQKNLSDVKAIWIGNTSAWDVDLGDCLRYMDGLEEIRICSGITSEEQEENAEKGFPFDNLDVSNMVDAQKGSGASLERVIVFPELEKWKVGDGYATFMLAMQYFFPDVKTNEPGKGWDGDEEALVAAADVDVVAANDSEEVVKVLEALLYQNEAEVAFEKGKSFQQKDGMPKLDGTCFVYFGDPFPDNSSQWPEGAASPDYDKLFSYTHIALVDEFAGTNVKTPHSAAKYDYFVYIYPTFEEVGSYGGTTAAYNTMTNVRVYDMKNEEKYESGVIETIEAPSEYRYSGSPDARYWPNMNKETAIAYIAGLA